MTGGGRLPRATRNPWRTLASRTVYESRHFRVREDEAQPPAGDPVAYPYIDYHDPVAIIVPVDAEGNVTLVRQWRYPWGEASWELPAGHCEPGEAPDAAARRELREETGLAATDWLALPLLRPGATLNTRFYPFIARGLAQSEHAREGSEGDMIVHALPLAEAVAAALDGEIRHAVSVAVLLQAARRLGV